MDNIIEIFKQRIHKESETRSSYNKYIFNSHLVMFLLIVFGAVLFNYSRWLETASIFQSSFILIIILSLLAYILTFFKIKTFIKEADVVFLLPLEESYKKIKNKLVLPIIFSQTFLSLLFFGAVYPIVKKLNISFYNVLSFLIAIVIVIAFSTVFKYDKVVSEELEGKDYTLIFLVYFLIVVNFAIFQIPIISTLLALCVCFIKVKVKTINWYKAAEYDLARNERYLKFVNMFVDVPINSIKVSRRKYLDVFLTKLTKDNFNSKNTFSYYYVRAFLRQENSIFLVIRLLIVALLFVYSLGNIYVSVIVIISFNYLTIIQLIPLYKKFNSLLWMQTLPVDNKLKKLSFKKLVLKVLTIASIIIFILAILVNFSVINIGYLVASIIASIFLNNYFLGKIK